MQGLACIDVRSLIEAYHRDILLQALRPGGELLARCGAEGVCATRALEDGELEAVLQRRMGGLRLGWALARGVHAHTSDTMTSFATSTRSMLLESPCREVYLNCKLSTCTARDCQDSPCCFSSRPSSRMTALCINMGRGFSWPSDCSFW